MTFRTVAYGADSSCAPQCPRIIEAQGAITSETSKSFLAFARSEIQRPGLMNVMLIHSPGGSVSGSMALGRVLRQLGTVVVVARAMDAQQLPAGTFGKAQKGLAPHLRFVSGTCASACVYTLAGGKKRVVPPESRVAIHRMAGNVSSFDFGTREPTTRRVYAGDGEIATLTHYIRQMGVSTDLVGLAEAVPHEEARVLSTRDMARLKLASPRM